MTERHRKGREGRERKGKKTKGSRRKKRKGANGREEKGKGSERKRREEKGRERKGRNNMRRGMSTCWILLIEQIRVIPIGSVIVPFGATLSLRDLCKKSRVRARKRNKHASLRTYWFVAIECMQIERVCKGHLGFITSVVMMD